MNDATDVDPLATQAMQAASQSGGTTSTSASRSGRLEVRCPNCHSPSDVAADTSLTDITCGSCGSNFSLVDQSKATRMAPPLSQMGRFELIERLGVGGFGSVWKARDKELDRTVAIKVPRATGMTGEEQEKFFREARAAAQLRHPSIVSVHEVGRDGENVYIVSDFVRGVTLGDWLTGQKLTNREAAELCAKIADALDHAHDQGVIHRDLKPANIMIDGDGQPHLMDFGLARREVGEVTMTTDGQVLGTPAYMSPEQAQGEAHTADRRSDVYSLGVILFQLLTGELPFRGNARMLIHQVANDEPPSPRKLNSSVSRDIETITLKCLEKDPSRRYQTAGDLAAELRRFLAGEPILARPIGPAQRAWRWCRRRPAVAGLSAAIVVLLSLLAAAGQVAALRETAHRRMAEASESKAIALQQVAEASEKSAVAREEAATAARAAAEAAQRELSDAKQKADSTLYARTVSLAYQEWNADNVTRCEDLLDSTRPELRDWEWHYVKQLCHTDSITLLGLQGFPHHVRFHKDGVHVVCCSLGEAATYVWNRETGDIAKRHALYGLAVSGDGALIAATSVEQPGKFVVIVDSLTGEVVKRIEAHPGAIVAADLNADGSRMVTTGSDRKYKTWDVKTGMLLADIEEPDRRRAAPVAISPDGKLVAWKADQGTDNGAGWLVAHDAETGAQRYKIPEPIFDDNSRGIAFSPDGKFIATGPTDRIQIREAATGKRLLSLHGHRGLVFGLNFDPTSSRLVSCGYDETVRLWDVQSGRELLKLRGHKPGVQYGALAVAFSPDGTRLVSGGFDRTVKVWDVPSDFTTAAKAETSEPPSANDLGPVRPDFRQDLDWLMGHWNVVLDAAFTPDGKTVLTSGHDGTVKCFDVSTRRMVREFTEHGGSVGAVAVSPNGTTVASGGQRKPGNILVWSLESGEIRQTLTGHTGPVKKLRFLPRGDRLVSISGKVDSSQGELIIWDLQSGRALHNVKSKGEFNGLDVSSDGKLILTCGDGAVRLWNADTGEHLRDVGSEDFWCIALSPDMSQIAAGNNLWAVTILDAQSGEARWRHVEHTGGISSVSFTPNGKRLLSTSADGSPRLWDTASGDNLLTLRGHAALLLGARWSPDGNSLVCYGYEPWPSLRTIAPPEVTDSKQWPTIFADNFDREKLGDNWKPVLGNWSIENGAARADLVELVPGLNMASIATGPIAPANAEIALDAWAPQPLIAELVFLDEIMRNGVSSAYIGVSGTPLNHGEKGAIIAIQTDGGVPIFLAGKRTGFTFEPNRKYRFRTVRQRRDWKMFVDDVLVLEAEIPERFVTPVVFVQTSFGPSGSALFVDNLEIRVPPEAVDESTAIRLEYDLHQKLGQKTKVLDAIQRDASISDSVRAHATRFANLRGDIGPAANMDRVIAASRASAAGVAGAVAYVAEVPLDAPLSPFHRLVAGELMILGDQPDKAIDFITKAIENGGKETYFQKSLGWALWRANKRDEALRAFEKTLGQASLETADIEQWVAAYFLDLASEDEFVKHLADEARSTAAFAWFYIGQRYEADGAIPEAIKAYEAALNAPEKANANLSTAKWAAFRLEQLKKHSSTGGSP